MTDAEFFDSIGPLRTWTVHRSTSESAVPEGTTKRAVREIDLPNLLFDNLVSAQKDRLRHGETERLGGLEVHGHLKFCRELHREIARLRRAGMRST